MKICTQFPQASHDDLEIKKNKYCPIKTIAELTSFQKNGNSAAYHAASMDFHRTVDAFVAAGSKKRIPDVFSDTPASLSNGQPSLSPASLPPIGVEMVE